MEKLITYSEYMADPSNLHHAYYSQFVTDETLTYILIKTSIEKLLASTDPHLNDITSMRNGYWWWDNSPVNEALVREAGGYLARSDRTCIGKAGARMLIAEYRKES